MELIGMFMHSVLEDQERLRASPARNKKHCKENDPEPENQFCRWYLKKHERDA